MLSYFADCLLLLFVHISKFADSCVFRHFRRVMRRVSPIRRQIEGIPRIALIEHQPEALAGGDEMPESAIISYDPRRHNDYETQRSQACPPEKNPRHAAPAI